MPSRKLGYVVSVVLLAIIFSIPHVLVGTAIGTFIYRNRSLMPLPGLGWVAHGGSPIANGTFWNNGFVVIDFGRHLPHGEIEWVTHSIDPETGRVTDLGLNHTDSSSTHFSPNAFGERLFFITYTGSKKGFEAINGVLKPSSVTSCPSGLDGSSFLWNQELAFVESGPAGFFLQAFQNGSWQRRGEVVLPEPAPPALSTAARAGPYARGLLRCYHHDDQLHLFLNLDGRLYYREGIELKAISTTSNFDAVAQDVPPESTPDAQVVHNSTDLAGWTLVRSTDAPIDWHQYFYDSQGFMGMFIEGKPAAFVVDDFPSANPVGHVYRFDGTHWSEFASQPLPFGSLRIRAANRSDHQCSYVVATTTTGSTLVYAVDANGIRRTDASVASPVHAIHSLFVLLWYPSGIAIWATLLGTGTWALMRWYTKPDYEFGVYSVKLASLGWRAAARLMDLVFIGTTTLAIGWLLTRDLDWLMTLEAFNLKLEHPTIHAFARATTRLFVWIVCMWIALILTQAAWGITPGKWLCGLRTVRTTLRPCGFARSLAREVVLFVDSSNLMCWAPGIVSIALTEHRQRLGDLVADTLVINAKSFESNATHPPKA